MAARSSLLPTAHVVGLDHVQLAMPEGGEPLAREFYGGLLGVERCNVADPFGNRIELVAAKDGGFTERQRPSSDAR